METYFAENLRLIRKSCSLNQKELADKLGLKRATISTYERGDNIPKLDTLLKIKLEFGISLDDLVCTKLKANVTILTTY